MPAVVVDGTPGAHLDGHPSLAALETLLQKVESTTAAAAESTRTHTDFRRLHHDPVCAVASVVARRLKQSIGGHAAAIAAAEAARSGSLADGVRLPELDMAPLLVTPFTGPLETVRAHATHVPAASIRHHHHTTVATLPSTRSLSFSFSPCSPTSALPRTTACVLDVYTPRTLSIRDKHRAHLIYQLIAMHALCVMAFSAAAENSNRRGADAAPHLQGSGGCIGGSLRRRC